MRSATPKGRLCKSQGNVLVNSQCHKGKAGNPTLRSGAAAVKSCQWLQWGAATATVPALQTASQATTPGKPTAGHASNV